ncbi:helix-turn-helix transcriptional regulator, partial [Salmonella enterica subsp. enterica serovar Kentucky]|nr:helix-turn-helix transcriptional regulator [Salmonella enterica subsp. enterica serovar Kentucky]
IENVAWADTIRVQPNYPQLSRRNLHALSLNIFKDEGREAFLKWQSGRKNDAQRVLLDALQLANRTGFISHFVIEGEAMAQQLRQ